ncbi:hypothetical protein HAX54_000278, partial [Datura stramonium]|nr:hypothetical protein [Datura stramonium]
ASIANNTTNLPPQSKMQTRNKARSIVHDASIGAQTVPADTLKDVANVWFDQCEQSHGENATLAVWNSFEDAFLNLKHNHHECER